MSQSGAMAEIDNLNVNVSTTTPAKHSSYETRNSLVTSLMDRSQQSDAKDATQDSEENMARASILSSVLNLCNSIVGAALLGLPFAADQVGWITSIVLLSVFALLSAFTFQLQTSSGILYNSATNTLSSSYSNLCQATVPKLQIFADVTILVNTFGSICAYLVIIGDLMPDAMARFVQHQHGALWNNLLLQRRFWISVYMAVLIIPCSLFKKLDFLRFTSFFAVVCFVFITISMVIFFDDASVNVCDKQLANNACGLHEFLRFNNTDDVFDFFKATPVYTFAFGTHPLAFSLTNELLNSSHTRMNIVIVLSFAITSVYYIVIGVLGYWTFGGKVQANILNNYPQDSSLLFGVRIGLSLALAFSYPVVITPLRVSFASLVYSRRRKFSSIQQLSNQQFYMITSVVIAASFVVAMTVSDLGIVFGIIGSTSSPAVILILPGIFYYYIDKKRYRGRTLTCWERCNKYGSIVCVIGGVVLVALSLFVFFLDNT